MVLIIGPCSCLSGPEFVLFASDEVEDSIADCSQLISLMLKPRYN